MFWYNFLQHIGLILGLPLLIPHLLLSEKRRRTVLPRMGWKTIRGETGRPLAPPGGRRIWVHALSVGEVLSARPLVTALRARFPDSELLFSASTLSGFHTAEGTVAEMTAARFYFPYDLHAAVRRVLKQVRPDAVVIVETDLWPNFMALCHRQRIPVFLVNARLSDRSFRGYRLLRGWITPLLRRFAAICTQTRADRLRFEGLGAERHRLHRTGNLKFDRTPPESGRELLQAWRDRLGIGPDQPLLVAGSTHPGEEEMVAAAFSGLKRRFPHLRLIIAPRDPGRWPVVRTLFQRQGWTAASLSDMESGGPSAAPVIGVDRMGVLATLYGLGSAAFVGGSLVPAGGHNPLEPAALGRPVLFGPHMTDFREIAAMLEREGAALRVTDAESLARAAALWLEHPSLADRAGAAGERVFAENAGAVRRTIDVIGRHL